MKKETVIDIYGSLFLCLVINGEFLRSVDSYSTSETVRRRCQLATFCEALK